MQWEFSTVKVKNLELNFELFENLNVYRADWNRIGLTLL